MTGNITFLMSTEKLVHYILTEFYLSSFYVDTMGLPVFNCIIQFNSTVRSYIHVIRLLNLSLQRVLRLCFFAKEIVESTIIQRGKQPSTKVYFLASNTETSIL